MKKIFKNFQKGFGNQEISQIQHSHREKITSLFNQRNVRN
jgi:hypothetical protein